MTPLVDLARVEETLARLVKAAEDARDNLRHGRQRFALARLTDALPGAREALAAVTGLAEAVERTEKALDAEQEECATWRMRYEAAQEDNARLRAALERLRNAVDGVYPGIGDPTDDENEELYGEMALAMRAADAALAPAPTPPGDGA